MTTMEELDKEHAELREKAKNLEKYDRKELVEIVKRFHNLKIALEAETSRLRSDIADKEAEKSRLKSEISQLEKKEAVSK